MEIIALIVFMLILGSAVIVFGKRPVAKIILGLCAVLAILFVLAAIGVGIKQYQETRKQKILTEKYERVGGCIRTENPVLLSEYANIEIGKRALERIGNYADGIPQECEAFKIWYRSVRGEQPGYSRDELIEMGGKPAQP